MPQEKDLKCLDDLIADLGGADHGVRTVGPSGLLLEQIQAARRGLLGSMRAEYKASLEHAAESIACVPDKHVRADIKKALRRLIDSEQDAGKPLLPVS